MYPKVDIYLKNIIAELLQHADPIDPEQFEESKRSKPKISLDVDAIAEKLMKEMD